MTRPKRVIDYHTPQGPQPNNPFKGIEEKILLPLSFCFWFLLPRFNAVEYHHNLKQPFLYFPKILTFLFPSYFDSFNLFLCIFPFWVYLNVKWQKIPLWILSTYLLANTLKSLNQILLSNPSSTRRRNLGATVFDSNVSTRGSGTLLPWWEV